MYGPASSAESEGPLVQAIYPYLATRILVVYLAIMAVAVPPLLAIGRKSIAAMLFVSGVGWLAVQLLEINVPYFDGTFDPLAYQFLFAIGMAVAIYYYNSSSPKSFQPTKAALAIAGIIVVASLSYRVVDYLSEHYGVLEVIHRDWLIATGKYSFAPIRLVHFVAVVIVVATFIRSDAAFLRSKVAQPIIVAGQHSLQFFCLGAVLSICADTAATLYGDVPLALRFLVDAIVLGTMYGLAVLFELERRRRLQISIP